ESVEYKETGRNVLDRFGPRPFVEVAAKTGLPTASILQALVRDVRVAPARAYFEGFAPLLFVAQSRAPLVIFEPTDRRAESLPSRGRVGGALFARRAYESVARFEAARNIRPP